MNSKVCCFLVLVGLSCALASTEEFLKLKVDEKCGTDQTCQSAAKRCLGTKNIDHHFNDGGLSPTEKLAAFNQCLDENGQGAKQINEADCVDGGPTAAGGRVRRSHHGKCKKEILDLLTVTLEESVAAPIRCCYATAIKSQKVASDGSIKLDYFLKKLDVLITDQTVKDIYKTVFNACLPKGANCDVYSFKDCSVRKCIDDLQALGQA